VLSGVAVELGQRHPELPGELRPQAPDELGAEAADRRVVGLQRRDALGGQRRAEGVRHVLRGARVREQREHQRQAEHERPEKQGGHSSGSAHLSPQGCYALK
jgi:hypothetical protein